MIQWFQLESILWTAGGVRRAGSGGVLLFPRVLPVPSSGGCTDLICSQFMLLRDHIGAQARLAHLHQANIPKKGNQVEDKLELQNKNPNNFLHTPCVSWMRSRQRQQQFWGHGHRQWDSRWCQGSVREIGGGEFFVQFHFGWDHAIPHDRVFILLLPRCHTQLGGRSNSMWGENIIATFHSCILFGKYRFWSKILRLVSILL